MMRSASSSGGPDRASSRSRAFAYAACLTANRRSSWRAVGGQRPPAVGREPREQLLERHVEPDGQAVHVDGGAVVRIHERAAAGGHDHVPQRQQQPQDFTFDAAEVRFSLAREDVRDRPPLASLDQFVDVLGPPAEPRSKRSRYGGFSGRHESDEVNLVDGHRTRVSRSSSPKKPG